MNKYLTILLFALLFSPQGFSQTACFAGADYSQGIVFIMENNRIVWSHSAPECNDLWALPNGNLLFTTGRGVLEVTRGNDTVFHYSSSSAIFACQRLKNGNTFIGECNTGRLLEVSPRGKIVKEVCILPEGTTDGGFAFMRNARRLDNGNYLVAHYGGEAVKEYSPEGKVVWSLAVPGGPHSVIRLPNGHTLIAVADKTRNPRIIEVDRSGKELWSLSNNDLPGAPLKFLGGIQYFPDGRLLFTNWTGHEKPDRKTHLFLVDRNRNVLYTLKDSPGIETMSSVVSLEKQQEGKAIYH